MPVPSETQQKKIDPTGQNEAERDSSAEVERLVVEQLQEIRKENEALRRENAALQERVEEYRGLHMHECREALDLARTYSQELAAPNEALRESEEKYRMVADFIYDWVYWLGPDGRYHYVSPSCERITGYRAEEFLADPTLLEHIVHPDDRALVAGHLTRTMQGSSTQGADLRSIVFRIITRNGEECWIEHYCQPVYDRNGQYFGRRGSNRDITEQKLAGEAVREREEQLQNLIERSVDGITITDETGRITTWNKGMEMITGLTAREVLGMPALEIQLRFVDEEWAGPDYRRMIRSIWEKLLRDGTPPYANCLENVQIRTPQGEVRHLQQSTFTSPTRRGFLAGFILRDITEEKRMEEALRESEERFMGFMDNSPAIAWMKDEQGRHVYLNKSSENRFNIRLEDWRGKTDFELWPLSVAEQFRENDRTVLEGNRTIEIVEEMPDLEGETAYWWNFKFPFQDASGRRYVGGIGIDITTWKRSEAALQASEEKYRNLVELAPEPIVVHRQGIIVYVNPLCLALFGAERREDLVGKTIFQFIHPDDHDRVKGRIREMTDRGAAVPRIAERFVKLNGQIVHVEVVATPVVYENLPSAMVLFRDVTERKRAEEALERHAEDLTRLQRELEGSNREANLYLDILTHDIGNTENVSNLYADLLIDSLQRKEEAIEYVLKLQRSVQKSIEILKTVSTIRRIHRASPELKPMDLDAAVSGVIESVPGRAIHYNRTNLRVQADDLLSVIFTNLIGNAVKHGGADDAITVRVEEQDGEVLVSVEDTGPGVPDADKEAIFHRYEQHKRGVGEGLGLYLVQILVERYGGMVWVEDRVPGHPEEGAAFWFTLRKAA